MTAPIQAAERIVAHELRPGTQVILYGGPVYVTDVKPLPEFEPAKRIQITYRKDFYGGTFLIGQTVVGAMTTFPVYDDGEAF